MKILIDMNLSPIWLAFFKSAGIEATHWSEIGTPTAPDAEIFLYAKQHEYVVFTHDLDFGSILAATNASAPSVFQLRTQDVTPEGIGDKVLICLAQFHQQLLSGCLLTLDVSRSKVRMLPFN